MAYDEKLADRIRALLGGEPVDPRRRHRGADPERGSGLLGLKDRIEALGGTLVVTSRPRDGTSIVLDLPIERF